METEVGEWEREKEKMRRREKGGLTAGFEDEVKLHEPRNAGGF